MADDLQNYKLQLQQVSKYNNFMHINSPHCIAQCFPCFVTKYIIILLFSQVEAALQTDSTNSELLKLKEDLIEVIELTKDLIKTQLNEQQNSSYVESKAQAISSSLSTDSTTSDTIDEIEAALLAAEKSTRRQWNVGDTCQAKWSEDSNFYDAIIEDITESGEVSIVFEAYQNRGTTTLEELRERTTHGEVFPSSK